MLIRTGTIGQPAHAPTTVRVLAPAKVNLFLEILAKRPDQFHELNTLMVGINLCDELTLSRTDVQGNEARTVTLTTDVPGLTIGPDNHVCQAAACLQAYTGCSYGAAIHLTKRIPWAAGLGGGSADAAATLAGLNDLWNLNLTRAELQSLAASIGSDVPFFLGPTSAAWCTGRGEILTPFPMRRAWDMLLVQGPEGIRTADVYRHVRVPTHPVSDTRIRAALAANDLNELGRSVHNRLQEPAFALAPSTATLFAHLQTRGAAGCFMSGSGSCLVALVDSASEAQRIADDLLSGSAPEVPPGTRTYIVQSCIDSMPTA